MKLFKFKRLKIVEQIAIVIFFAVLIPMSISGFIINNINQQSVRSQLRETAILIANMVSDEIDFFIQQNNMTLNQMAYTLEFMPSVSQKENFMKEMEEKFGGCEDIAIVKYQADLERLIKETREQKKATIYTKLKNGDYLVVIYNIDNIQSGLFRSLGKDNRQIYVLAEGGKLLAAHNYTEEVFQHTMDLLPKYRRFDEPVIFGDVKNQPIVYVTKQDPKITIIVNTTEGITKRAINDNRLKIILAFLAATATIIFVTALYTYYLYINIRQLFKGIIAVSKGNYNRQIRLLTTAFTPYEIVFLAFEFNKMANAIHKSYLQLQKNNVELKELNEFRSNLIDTVSHELRTPLTSIQGYTSRLMRHDIQIDEETKQKSLRIIKEQSERLQRLIEDLLTIPDIERMRIQTVNEPVNLAEVLERSEMLLRKKDGREILIKIQDNFPLVYADKGRLEQVFVNLLENAVKYSYEDSIIRIETSVVDNQAKIYVKNDCDVIPKDKLQRLFGKFIRLDDNTTRTTRGTGLGLFIVKGLVEAMNGKIELSSTDGCGFCAEVTIDLAGVEDVYV
ncbi:MAG: GHKL domain-containing protein [Cyanobacteria bacterium SIG32]|nr:GHKL domain-containing protein [Cyanobacteria bacterium SIG32]